MADCGSQSGRFEAWIALWVSHLITSDLNSLLLCLITKGTWPLTHTKTHISKKSRGGQKAPKKSTLFQLLTYFYSPLPADSILYNLRCDFDIFPTVADYGGITQGWVAGGLFELVLDFCGSGLKSSLFASCIVIQHFHPEGYREEGNHANICWTVFLTCQDS